MGNKLIRYLIAFSAWFIGSYTHAGPVALDLQFSTEGQSQFGSGGSIQPALVDETYGFKLPTLQFGQIVGSADSCLGVGLFGGCAGIDNVDTQTGFAAGMNTWGAVRFQSTLGVDSGSVGAQLGLQAAFNTPDNAQVGQFVNLGTSSDFTSGLLTTTFPKLTGKVSVGADLAVYLDAEACFITQGCTTLVREAVIDTFPMSSLVRVGAEDALFPAQVPGVYLGYGPQSDGPALREVFEINTPNLVDKASLFGLDALAFDATQGDYTVLRGLTDYTLTNGTSVGVGFPVAAVKFDYPDLPTSGSSIVDGMLESDGDFENILALEADVDFLASVALGLPPAGFGISIGKDFSVILNLIDADIGPTVDLSQEFSLTPTLWVNLGFSQDVMLEDGTLTNFLSGQWDQLPSFALLSPENIVTPEFYISALFNNKTQLNLDVEFDLSVLEIEELNLPYNPFDFEGALYDPDPIELFDLGDWTVFNDTFQLGGFQSFFANPFTLYASLPGNQGGEGGPSDPTTSVPEPGTLSLLAAGLAGLGFATRRRKSR